MIIDYCNLQILSGPLMINGMLVGLIFCNTTFIQDQAVELQNVSQNHYFILICKYY